MNVTCWMLFVVGNAMLLANEGVETVGESDYREVENFINILRGRLAEIQQAFKLQTHQTS